MVSDARKKLNDLDGFISQLRNVSDDQRQRATALRRDVETIIDQKRDDRLPKKMEQIMALCGEVMMQQPEVLVAMFQLLQQKRGQMRDPTMADRLFQQGQACIQRGDEQMLRQVVVQLFGLLPQEVADDVRSRGYSGLAK